MSRLSRSTCRLSRGRGTPVLSYPVDRTHYLAQFQAYDPDDNRVFHYLLTDVSGKTIAITKPVPLNILHLIAGVPYGVEVGDDGTVTVVVLALDRTLLEGTGS
ncbi:MAG: hypothetical protein ACE5HT_12170 [Gemmatimonadales bacterium]